MSSYTIYYTCLSELNIRSLDPVKVLLQLEKGEIRPEAAGQKREGALHEYTLKLSRSSASNGNDSNGTEKLDFFDDYQQEDQTSQRPSTINTDFAGRSGQSADTAESEIPAREEVLSGKKTLDDVYGIQTNEAALKLVLQAAARKGQCIDELIIAATTSIYNESKLTCSRAYALSEGDDAGNETIFDRKIRDELAAILAERSGEFCEIQTLSDCTLDNRKGECSSDDPSSWKNTLDYFFMEVSSYCRNVLKRSPDQMIHRISIYPLSDDARRGEMSNCAISVAQKAIDAQKTHDDINLMIDTNGGPRDMAVFQLATIRALKVHGISARYALYSKFNPKNRNSYWGKENACKVSDKTYEYEIFDVVSGIDEFVEYGRVDRLLDYFRMTESGVLPVLESVKKMSETFMTCFTDAMVQSVVEVKGRIEEFESLDGKDIDQADFTQGHKADEKKTQHGSYYKLAEYVVGQIRDDMAEVLDAVGEVRNRAKSTMSDALQQGDGELCACVHAEPLYELVDDGGEAKAILPLIAWCKRKKFYQQAYTLYVDRIDYWYRINDILKTPTQHNMNSASNGQQEKTDLYSRLYVDVLEVKYKSLAQQYAATVPGQPFNRNTYLSKLKEEQNKNYVISSSLDQYITKIQNNEDVTGNPQGVNLTSRQILEHAEKLMQDIRSHPAHFVTGSPSQMSGRKSTLMKEICPGFPKTSLIDKLQTWRDFSSPDLHLDTQLINAVIADVRNGYDEYGMIISSHTMQGMHSLFKKAPEDLYKFVHDNLTNCYRKLCREHIAGSELGNHIAQDILDALAENGEKPKDTYIRKKIAITHFSVAHAQSLVGSAIDPDKAYDLIVDMARYYLAFKIIRNNSNHSNGKGDAYAYETCKWLSMPMPDRSGSKPVLDADSCIFDDTNYTVTFGYQTTEKLLDRALQFNGGILSKKER